ncbi:MAG TPA: Gfo/Idh/MocA family oxidoreductase [Candidatus Limnocylindrales bacterium]
MFDHLNEIAQGCRIRIPDEHKRPIAIVGAGEIVDVAHLPAYRAHDLDVRGIFDINVDRARDVAARHAVPTVYPTLEALLADDGVEVVDIAVVAPYQPEIAHAALGAGKHLLCQKPLAPDLATARALVGAAEEAGLKVAVNQQFRWDEGMCAARAMVRRGWIGEVTTMSFTVDVATDFSAWNWLVESDRLEIMYHSIHYLDAVRSVMGNPTRVFATAARLPGQKPKGETHTISTLVFDRQKSAVLNINHNNLSADLRAEFRISGTLGTVHGTLGLLANYPHGGPDTLRLHSTVLPTDGWLSYPVSTRWIPDAFAGPVAGLLDWIATGRTAPTAARDNLHTLAVVDALYRSIDSGHDQELEVT